MPLAVRQDSARFIVFVVLIIFLYVSSNSPSSSVFSRESAITGYTSWLKESLTSLNSTRWDDFSPRGTQEQTGEPGRYLNLTGFRDNDRYRGWERFRAWRETCALLTQEAMRRVPGREHQQKMIYTNITGIVHGKWARYESDLANINGKNWSAISLSEVAPGVRWAFEQDELWTRNITGKNGRIRIRLEEKQSDSLYDDSEKSEESSLGHVGEVAATITLEDINSSREGWEMRLHGVHWPEAGILVMTTTSDKFAGIFGLPHLTANLQQFTSSQKLLYRTLEKTIGKFEKDPRGEYPNPWVSSLEARRDDPLPAPHCEFVVFAQVFPFPPVETLFVNKNDPSRIVKEIEDELRFPNGAPTPKIPRLQVATAILSPDCGFILESQGPPRFAFEDGRHLLGNKQEVIISSIRFWLEIFAVMIFAQTLLLKAQSKQASTPSTVGRVSLHTISMMLFADSFIFASSSLLSGTSPYLFPSGLLVSFMSLMSIMLEIRFLGAIWNSQEPERREYERQLQASQATSVLPSMQPNSAIQPNTTVAETSVPTTDSVTPLRHHDSNPIIIPSDQDIDAEILENSTNEGINTSTAQGTAPARRVSAATIYIRFILLLTLILFLTLTSTSWPAWLRTTYIYCLSLTYLSFPALQIRRNIKRNCRKALLWKFLIGQSVLRLTPFAYFYLVEDNILFVERDTMAFCILAGWLWIQCWLLVAQNIVGPRWGLPKTWYDESWDYHPIIRDDNIEAGSANLPIGLARIQKSSTAPYSPLSDSFDSTTDLVEEKKKRNSMRSVDCAICMQLLEVPVLMTGKDTSGGVAGILERRRYMVTPCRHIFHSKCLEGWMRFRLQCPICRENLPPL